VEIALRKLTQGDTRFRSENLMKSLIVLASFVSISAMANISVSKISSNGSVAPQYHHTTICKIAGRSVTSSITGYGISDPPPAVRSTIYTRNVPNESVMESLAGDAARAPVQHHPGPIGGPVVSYLVNIDAGQAALLVRSGNVIIQQNNSAASLKLQKFIDKNCQ
jgi:hypothetical protein